MHKTAVEYIKIQIDSKKVLFFLVLQLSLCNNRANAGLDKYTIIDRHQNWIIERKINSMDSDDLEGVDYTDSVTTHPEVIAPVFKLEEKINSIALSWDPIPDMEGKYKIIRNGNKPIYRIV